MSARSFARASLAGNPVGRPPTAAANEPSRAARALIAAKRYEQSKRRDAPDPSARVSGGISAPGELLALRAAARQEEADWMKEGARAGKND